ncbi:Flp family type IVb pilin [Novosphingobium bradum]|uniref:Flp family type IVb pilin n=1 Tax=Novosphingobium bradum TaxID=1737444 RepID=A0ABV7IPV7_9SPHN
MNLVITIRQLLRDCRAATAVEYGLIAALVVVTIMFTVQGVANETNAMWSNVGSTMQRATAA